MVCYLWTIWRKKHIKSPADFLSPLPLTPPPAAYIRQKAGSVYPLTCFVSSCSHTLDSSLTFLFFFFLIFIVIQLQLCAFSPHPSTPPQLNPPPSPTSTLPLDFVHVSFIVVPVIPWPFLSCFILALNQETHSLLPLFFSWKDAERSSSPFLLGRNNGMMAVNQVPSHQSWWDALDDFGKVCFLPLSVFHPEYAESTLRVVKGSSCLALRKNYTLPCFFLSFFLCLSLSLSLFFFFFCIVVSAYWLWIYLETRSLFWCITCSCDHFTYALHF